MLDQPHAAMALARSVVEHMPCPSDNTHLKIPSDNPIIAGHVVCSLVHVRRATDESHMEAGIWLPVQS